MHTNADLWQKGFDLQILCICPSSLPSPLRSRSRDCNSLLLQRRRGAADRNSAGLACFARSHSDPFSCFQQMALKGFTFASRLLLAPACSSVLLSALLHPSCCHGWCFGSSSPTSVPTGYFFFFLFRKWYTTKLPPNLSLLPRSRNIHVLNVSSLCLHKAPGIRKIKI